MLSMQNRPRSDASATSQPWKPTPKRNRRHALRAIWTPSLLRRTVRHRGARIAACLIAALVAFTSVAGERAALQAERDSWESTVVAVEVIRFVPAGGEVGGAVRLVDRPAAVVPDGALGSIPSDGLAAVDLVPGELVLAERVRQAGEGQLPAGTVAITIELDGEAALVVPGALVDVWATDAANFSSRRVVDAALVLQLDDRDLTIAIPEGAAGPVAVASLRPLTVTVVR